MASDVRERVLSEAQTTLIFFAEQLKEVAMMLPADAKLIGADISVGVEDSVLRAMVAAQETPPEIVEYSIFREASFGDVCVFSSNQRNVERILNQPKAAIAAARSAPLPQGAQG